MKRIKNKEKADVCRPMVIPKYQTYPETTAILAILSANNNSEEWIYNNFLLVWSYVWVWDDKYWCDYKFGHNEIKGELCPMIERIKINKLEFVEMIYSKFQRKGEKTYDSRNKARRYITKCRCDKEKLRNSSK